MLTVYASSGGVGTPRRAAKGYYGPDQITYQLNWLKCARDAHGLDIDWLGLWNERPWGTPEFVALARHHPTAHTPLFPFSIFAGALPLPLLLRGCCWHAAHGGFLSPHPAHPIIGCGP